MKNAFKPHCLLFHAVHKLYCWQPLQKQLNLVSYLGGFVVCFFKKHGNVQHFAVLLFHVVCGLQTRACHAFDGQDPECVWVVSPCMLSRQWLWFIMLHLERVNVTISLQKYFLGVEGLVRATSEMVKKWLQLLFHLSVTSLHMVLICKVKFTIDFICLMLVEVNSSCLYFFSRTLLNKIFSLIKPFQDFGFLSPKDN